MASILHIDKSIRNLRRYAEIVRVLVGHGFEDVVQEVGLERVFSRGMRIVGAKRLAAEFAHLPRKVRLRRAMEALGPTFIKLGQVLSTRPDLIPEEWAEEFKLLQDDCPKVAFAQIKATLVEEFGEQLPEIFASIDQEPLAAGSMAQAHRAKLATGEDVVIKVLRPGIHAVTAADMEALRLIASFAEQHFADLGYSPTEVVNEFARELVKEVDLTHEGRSTDRLRRNFEGDEGVVFPKVYWHATTPSVLTIEEIHGVLLSRLKEGQLTLEDRKSVVANGARAVMRQCLEIGFFHADPHPGNLFAMSDGRIAFIDCGMTGQLDDRTSQQLAELVAGVVDGDLDQVITVISNLADVDYDKLESRPFRADVREFVSHFHDVPLEQLNMGKLLKEFFDKLRAHHIRCPGDMVLLIKALSTIESVGLSLDPDFEVVSFARPYIEKLVKRKYSIGELRRRLRGGLFRYAELAEDLPGQVRGMLSQIRKNKFAINLEHRGLARLTHTIEHASRNISFALIISAMLVGSSILVLSDRGNTSHSILGLTALGIGGFLLAAVLVVVMVISNRRFRE
ncbi:MAG: ABC1 kinase family protein [Phycisphaerales bacterium]